LRKVANARETTNIPQGGQCLPYNRAVMIRRRHVLIALLVVLSAGPIVAARPHFVPPADSATDTQRIVALKAALEQKNYTDAAALLDALLGDDGDKLAATDDGGLISIAAWVESLPFAQKTALTAAYREKFDPGIRTKLDLLHGKLSVRPEEFYALGHHFPLSAAGAAAYALAADRFLELGDTSAAYSLYLKAMRGGWTPEEPQAAQIELLRQIAEGKIIPANETKGERPAFVGPLPFDAPWFDAVDTAGQPRFFPSAGGERIFLTTPHSAIALKENGQIAWSSIASLPTMTVPPRKPLAPPATERAVEGSRRPAYNAPGILADVYGRAQMLIARQLSSQSPERDREFCLSAYRASDGKLLWSTENQAYMRDLSFASAPAVCGRYTYAVALTPPGPNEAGGDQSVGLYLVALDTLTGDYRWQTALGRFNLTVQDRGQWSASQPWDEAWEQSEPLAAGDAVYVTPNAGLTVAIGRFDGELRWLRPYPTTAGDAPRPPRTRAELRQQMDDRRHYFEAIQQGAKPAPPTIDPALGERWRGTPVLCGNVLIAAPQDTLGVYGFDAATGRLIWSADDLDVPTLIGQTPTTALFAGGAITSVEARNGKASWRWEPPRGSRITGPTVVRGSTVLVPTITGIVTTLRADDGSMVKEPPTVPLIRKLLNAESVKRELEEMGAAKGFGLQAVP
jgi:hypothetical protein